MSETKHSPLPWRAEMTRTGSGDLIEGYWHVIAGNINVADVCGEKRGETDDDGDDAYIASGESAANVRLICRAVNAHEDLLAACKALIAEPYGCAFCDSGELRKPENGHTEDCPYLLARAAIARAEGRTP